MSLCRLKSLVVLAVTLALAACQFSPVYGPGSAASHLENRIYIPEPTTEELYIVTRQIETRLGRADPAPMKLVLSASHSGYSQATTGTGFATRIQRTGILTYTLSNTATGATIKTGRIDRFVGYSTTGNLATTLAAERDSIRRLMILLGDVLVDELVLIDPAELP